MNRIVRVLVAEDDPMVRKLLIRALRSAAFVVEHGVDGRSALEASERMPVLDLVLADVRMPRLGGEELVRELATRRTDFRALFVSGAHRDAQRAAQRASVPATYVVKPFLVATLLSKIDELLRR